VAWCERYVAVLPAGHPATADSRLDVEAIGALPLIAIPRADNPVMHDELLAVCRSIALEPRVRPTLSTPQETMAMIATGAAWTLFIEGNVPLDVPGLAECTLPEDAPMSRVWVVWRTVGAPAHVLAFVETATSPGEGGFKSRLPPG
jgi:DNA-binding transcriptional LysR family regulator